MEDTFQVTSLAFLLTGQTETTWDVRVRDDGLLENTENFVVYIHQPVNAVLGRRRKMRIRLINAEDGRSGLC